IKKAFNIPFTPEDHYDPGKLYIRYTYETVTDMNAFQTITVKGEN
ncbi:MAG: carboxylate--amine ligase, partial [bacterium]|nr:carboxylate--amine ligase [bacterium]